MRLRRLKNKLSLDTHGYDSTVYDPTYVYAPWRRWILLAIATIIVAAVIWLVVANTNESVPEQLPQQGTSGNTEPTHIAKLPTNSVDDASSLEHFAVIKVIDGDTIDVMIDGNIERLRLIGIDTPEIVDPRKPVQCFGTEASSKAKSLLSGAKVVLEQDTSQGERDSYGRLLVYVFLQDGTNFNQHMIAEGYAHEYTYRIPYKYQSEFKAAQTEARNSQKGLWAPSTCNGITS